MPMVGYSHHEEFIALQFLIHQLHIFLEFDLCSLFFALLLFLLSRKTVAWQLFHLLKLSSFLRRLWSCTIYKALSIFLLLFVNKFFTMYFIVLYVLFRDQIFWRMLKQKNLFWYMEKDLEHGLGIKLLLC